MVHVLTTELEVQYPMTAVLEILSARVEAGTFLGPLLLPAMSAIASDSSNYMFRTIRELPTPV